MSENEKNETQRPLTIAMVVDTSGNRGNGTSNSALQWAQELERQGHHVRLVGIGAPEYPARVNHVPLVSWVAKKQQMQFAEPSDTLFRKAFDGVDVVHIYTPFRFGQHACKVAKQMGIAVTAGYHVQPENVTYSAGPLKYVPASTRSSTGCSTYGCTARSTMCMCRPNWVRACCARMDTSRSCMSSPTATNRGSRRSGSARRTSRRRCRSVSSRRDD